MVMTPLTNATSPRAWRWNWRLMYRTVLLGVARHRCGSQGDRLSASEMCSRKWGGLQLRIVGWVHLVDIWGKRYLSMAERMSVRRKRGVQKLWGMLQVLYGAQAVIVLSLCVQCSGDTHVSGADYIILSERHNN